MFLAITFYLEWRKPAGRHIHAAQLARRLIIPWAIWTIVYGCYRLASQGSFLDPALSAAASLLNGTAPHLWYLPFYFSLQIIVRMVKASPVAWMAPPFAFAAVLLLTLTTGSWQPHSTSAGPPVAQYCQALPMVFFGLLVAEAERSGRVRFAVAICLAGFALLALTPWPGTGVPYLIGGFLVCCALLCRRWLGNGHNALSAGAPLLLGIFLTHPLFLLLAWHFDAPPSIMVVILSFIGAAAMTWLLRRYVGVLGQLAV